MALIFVDCEADGPCPALGKMTEFGAVEYETGKTFHGLNDSTLTMHAFALWLDQFPGRPIMVSDNPAFDFQWINDAFWRHMGSNPFGHSARRIADYYAGLTKDFRNSQRWKQWRITPHDHNPVNDAMGNVEAFRKMQEVYGGK